METKFWIELRGTKYDRNTGWNCAALALPRARVTSIVVDGTERALSDFKMDGPWIRFAGPPPETVPNGAALVRIDRMLVRVDTAIVVAVIGMLGSLGAAWLAQRQTRPAPVTLDSTRAPARADETAPMPISAPVAEPVGGRPSVLSVFARGRLQEFAGQGTIRPPLCHFVGKDLRVQIPEGYKEFAGCYVDLEQALNLTAYQNSVLRVELQVATEQLEIKLEDGSTGAGRRETYLHRGPAEAGPHDYPISGVARELIERCRRLTIAVAEKPGNANVIHVRR